MYRVSLNRGGMKKNKLVIALLFCTMISTSISVEGRMVNPDHVSFGISDSSIIDDNGGAVYVDIGPVPISGTTPDDILEFSRNSAKNGGAIYNAASMYINGATFNDNSASEKGGAIYNTSSGVINMYNVTVNAATETASNDIYNDGYIYANGTNNFNSNISGSGSVINTGTMKLGGGILSDTIQMTISEGSTLNIAGGRLNLNSGDTWNGSINLTSGTLYVDGVSGTLNATDGSYMAYGTTNIGAGSVINDAVEVYLHRTTNLNITGGTVDIGVNDHWLDGMINLSSGTLNVDRNAGALNATGGNYNVLGDTVLYTGGSVASAVTTNISSGATLTNDGGTLNLNSGDTWNGTVKLENGTLNVDGVSGTLNATGGNYNINGTSTLGTGSLVTNGVTTNLNSGSTLNIDGGLLGLNSGDTWNGTINLKNGTLNVGGVSGTLNATGGTYEVVTATTASIGTGSIIENAVFVDLQDGATLNIAGGTVNLNSNDHIINGIVNLSSGTLNLDATPGRLIATDGNLNLIGNTIMDVYGSIASAVATNINGSAVLTNSGGTVNLDSNDSWNGQIVNNYDGIINTDNFISNSSTASLVQTNGTLNITNGSELKLNTGSEISGGMINIQKDKVDATEGAAGSVFTANGNVITGGEMNIDKYSQFALQSGQFNIDVLNANGSDAVNAALINTMNGEIATSTIGTLSIDNQANFNIDIHARSNANNGNDKFIINDGDITGGGTAHIQDWTLSGDIYGWDAPIERHIKLGNIFENTDGNALMTGVTVTDKTVFTPIGWYQLNKNEEYEEVYEEFGNPGDSVEQIPGGILTRNHIGSNYTLDLVRYNPQVFRGQVVTIAQWMNQLNIADLLFTHSMVLPGFKEENGIANKSIMANRYAATSPIYAPYQYSRKDGGLWYKAYGTFENLQMNNGLSKVGNNSYGALIGADFGLKELRNDWKFMPTAYLGYNGAHQTFANVGAYQNGGQLGFLGTWYKNNLILGTTVYSGVYNNSMDVFGHNEDTVNYFAGTSAKAAYNIKLGKNWALQPNLFVSYNYFGQQNWHSNFGQMGMMAGDLHGVNIAPGVNLIWEKETFSAYATLQYMYNINGAVGGRAGNVNLPQMEMDRGYIQYGLGFVKKFTDRTSGYLQAVLRNVGRTGVGLQMGFNIYLGK